MGSAKKTSSAERKARIAEMRRAEAARERRARALTITLSAVIVAALGIGGYFLVSQADDDDESAKAGDAAAVAKFTRTKDGEKVWDAKKLGRTHVEGKVTYPVTPPVGGNHNQVWMNCNGDVYKNEIPNEHAVHSLEHGSVWVTYNDAAKPADLKKLEAKVKKTPYSLMSPVKKQKEPLLLTAWGHQRAVTGADDPKVNTFFSTFVQGKQTPEPGAACTNGKGQ
ncbi:DUF3105 domain-containing protein [Streptomyces spectabilis]|uniref:DUF3105 domain-containing protein n=1 Tax=Streptomyces spectabilis TaxID=68270 RepID=A0A5P2XAG5_STRST|nr:DUF3105 domain-containing protein [Streptomyces spectabilis]MBB5102979.1 hypothetical protein [Streptomyces spectabilis]MCI3902174.1 DUF3105 domain-containing protein [Streptomyces spectabilis]QEV59556.1 DUF3105 domain-containing protein [Streptomyces spectabilis]GGV15523.1 membrane protein [Streptomyces spectabilis]